MTCTWKRMGRETWSRLRDRACNPAVGNAGTAGLQRKEYSQVSCRLCLRVGLRDCNPATVGAWACRRAAPMRCPAAVRDGLLRKWQLSRGLPAQLSGMWSDTQSICALLVTTGGCLKLVLDSATALNATFQRNCCLAQVAEQQPAADDSLQTDAGHAILQQWQALHSDVMHCHFNIMGGCCAY